MKEYRVKIPFTDSEGVHKQGDIISLSDERAAKLLGFGKVVQIIEKPKAVKIELSGSEEITKALEEASQIIETLREQLSAAREAGAQTALTLQRTLDESTKTYRELVDSLLESKYIGQFEEIVSTLKTDIVDITEEIDV